MTERAATVIALPLSVVESNIWDVTSWPLFIGGVEWVERAGHERYLLGVRQGRRLHEVPAAVRWHARDHRVTWRELQGPAWRGEIRLTALNGRRTRVAMHVTAHPRTFSDSIAEMFGVRRHQVWADLDRLGERLASLPLPYNPERLEPSRRGTRRHRAAQPAGVERVSAPATT